MSMLKFIDLWTIDKLFSDAPIKLSIRSQILYIRALMFYWREKSASISNLTSFELSAVDLPYEANKKELEELSKAELITIKSDKMVYIFNDLWAKYIDKDRIPKVSAESFVGASALNDMIHFEKQLLESETTIELCCIKFAMTRDQAVFLIKVFIMEQKNAETKFANLAQVIKYCTNYVGFNKHKAPASNSVKSDGILLNKSLKTS